jgi:hypothetical protein
VLPPGDCARAPSGAIVKIKEAATHLMAFKRINLPLNFQSIRRARR